MEFRINIQTIAQGRKVDKYPLINEHANMDRGHLFTLRIAVLTDTLQDGYISRALY